MKHFFSFTTLVFFAFLFYASSPSKKATAPTKQTFTYSYKTTQVAKSGSANVVLALYHPDYATDFVRAYANSDVFLNFRRFMEDDVKQLLLDKGYSMKVVENPILYEDKKTVEVALEIKIQPYFTAAEGGWKRYQPLLVYGNAPLEWSFDGTTAIAGRVNITGYEPMSGQPIWVKTVEFPPVESIHIAPQGRFPANQITTEFLNDASVYNALGAALQKVYTGCMQKIDIYLDPREFVDLKPQIKELKSKKVF